MKVKVELELEVETEWLEVDNCTPENFKEHILFILKDFYTGNFSIDIDFVSRIKSLTFE